MKIWTLDDKLIDEIVKEYIDYVYNPLSEHRQTSTWFLSNEFGNVKIPLENRALRYDKSTQASMDSDDGNLPVIIDKLPRPQIDRTRVHFVSLIHQTYLRYLGSENGNIRFNSAILQKVYSHYNYMLDVLTFKSIIQRSTTSGVGLARIVYCIPDSKLKLFKYKECNNRKVTKDIDKIKLEFKKEHSAQIEKAKNRTSPAFIDNYNKSLKRYCFRDIKQIHGYMDNYNFESDNSKRYYQNTIDKIENNKIKDIDKIDDNGRLYHIVTQTPRLLRKYTNITTTVDARNSHPLLFNFFILEYYFNKGNINIHNNQFIVKNNRFYFLISDFIFNYNDNIINNFHYFIEMLCNYLKINGIKNENIAIIETISVDVWEYMASTSHGKLWTEINEAYPDLGRDEIKVQMFSSLFYSNSKKIYKDQIYAIAFREKYPKVAEIVNDYKSIFKNQCETEGLIKEIEVQTKYQNNFKPKIQLAHKLMQLESFIFTGILTKLYKNRSFRGVCIHDAIAIFDDTTDNDSVIKIMKKHYADIGLCPTFSIETTDFDRDLGTEYEDVDSIDEEE